MQRTADAMEGPRSDEELAQFEKDFGDSIGQQSYAEENSIEATSPSGLPLHAGIFLKDVFLAAFQYAIGEKHHQDPESRWFDIVEWSSEHMRITLPDPKDFDLQDVNKVPDPRGPAQNAFNFALEAAHDVASWMCQGNPEIFTELSQIIYGGAEEVHGLYPNLFGRGYDKGEENGWLQGATPFDAEAQWLDDRPVKKIDWTDDKNSKTAESYEGAQFDEGQFGTPPLEYSDSMHDNLDSLIEDLIITAVEGGTGYWAQVSEYDPSIPRAVLHENDEFENGYLEEPLVLDRDSVMAAIARVFNDPENNKRLHRDLTENDGNHIDGDTADGIAQLALLGEWRYG